MSTRIVTSCQPHRVMSDVQGDNDTEQSSSSLSSSSSSLPVTPAGVQGSNKASPPLSVTGQPLDGAPAVVHLHFCFHSSTPGCLRSTTLPFSLWGLVDCNFGDGLASLRSMCPIQPQSLLMSPYTLAGTVLTGHGWRWLLHTCLPQNCVFRNKNHQNPEHSIIFQNASANVSPR